MTAAQVYYADDETDPTITSTVNALIAGRGMRSEDVARAVQISVSQFYKKLAGGSPWKAREVAALARLLQVTVADLYDGLGGRFGPYVRAGATQLAAGDSELERARRDSNPQPSDP